MVGRLDARRDGRLTVVPDPVYVPYVFRPYPRHVHQRGGAFREVNSDAERDQAVAEGWSLRPVLEPLPVTEISAPVVDRAPPLTRGRRTR